MQHSRRRKSSPRERVLTAPRIDVSTGRTLNLNGGTLAFTTLNLLGTGNIAVGGDVTLGFMRGVGTIASTGSGGLSFGGATRTLNVNADTAANEVAITVPISNGGLTKTGSGTIRLTANNNTLLGAVTVNAGTLRLSGAAGALTASSGYTVNTGGTLTFDNAGNVNANRISSNPITMNGETPSIIGDASGVVTETAGNLTAAAIATLTRKMCPSSRCDAPRCH